MELHVGVLQPAKLGALSMKDASVPGLQADDIRAPGKHVHLAAKPRNPERVDDIGAADLHIDQAACGDDQLVGGDDAAVGITNLPPPLVADDRDRKPALGTVVDL